MVPLPIKAASRFVDALVSYYNGGRKEAPKISSWVAAGLSVSYTLLYVVPLYLSKKTRPNPQLSRDAPSVIRARIRAVTFACVASTLATAVVSVNYGLSSPRNALHLMGWWPLNPLDIAKTLVLVAILFVGPLFEASIVEGRWRDWLRGRHLYATIMSWIGWRTYVAGPMTEEILFRSAIVPLHMLAHESPRNLVFLTPLYFGIAHVHHFYEFKLTHPYTPWTGALLRSLFQFVYTSVFGFFAVFILLRTGNMFAAVAAHTFCNWMGFPRFWGRLKRPMVPASPDIRSREDEKGLKSPNGVSSSMRRMQDSRPLGIGWTIAYYTLLVVGSAGFYLNLWSLTDSRNAIIDFHSSPKAVNT